MPCQPGRDAVWCRVTDGPRRSGLLERLDVERLDRDLFRGTSPQDGRPRVFGGQVAAQALAAAARCIEDPALRVHSLHAYFLRPGDPSRPILYEVDRMRDGRSFQSRRVVAAQGGEAILHMSASFHREEVGLDHTVSMPDVPPPEAVPSSDALIAAKAATDPFYRFLSKLERPLLVHDVEVNEPSAPSKRPGPHHVWLRAREELPDDPFFHSCVLAYASDLTLAEASLRVHGRTWFDPRLVVASLDHAVWFHRAFRADEWLLYQTESPTTSGSRGLNLGRIFQRGTLVASVAQESLMREGPPAG